MSPGDLITTDLPRATPGLAHIVKAVSTDGRWVRVHCRPRDVAVCWTGESGEGAPVCQLCEQRQAKIRRTG